MNLEIGDERIRLHRVIRRDLAELGVTMDHDRDTRSLVLTCGHSDKGVVLNDDAWASASDSEFRRRIFAIAKNMARRQFRFRRFPDPKAMRQQAPRPAEED